ncbi:MAG: PepSY domain-containing protein [Dokdonella sp.]
MAACDAASPRFFESGRWWGVGLPYDLLPTSPEFSRNSMPAKETALLNVQLRAGKCRAKMQTKRQQSIRQGGIMLGLLLCGALLVPLAWARQISVEEAVSKAQQEAEGKVLSVQTLNVGKRKVYRIKLLTRDGQVRVVQVPAEQ